MNIETVQDLVDFLTRFSPDAQVYDIDGMSIVENTDEQEAADT